MSDFVSALVPLSLRRDFTSVPISQIYTDAYTCANSRPRMYANTHTGDLARSHGHIHTDAGTLFPAALRAEALAAGVGSDDPLPVAV